MSDVDRLVELITQKVRDRLDGRTRLAVVPRDRGECNDDSAPGEDCAECGVCVVRRPWSVRAMEGAGAERVGAAAGVGEVPADLAKLIDHTLLKPEATRDEVVKLCEEARKYRFASVCVNTTWVPLCKSLLAGTDVMVCAVVGFPLGAMTPTAKAYEAREAVRQGAREIDMVLNIGALKSRDYETVFEDICRVVKASAPAGVKVILETSALSHEEKIIAISLSKLAGAAFVKTSTGFGKGGATVEDVQLMRRLVGSELGVKASGGVRTVEDAIKMAQAGANRIGASASVAIVTGTSGGKGY
jgi:deoxyribose-phosphate aldolase